MAQLLFVSNYSLVKLLILNISRYTCKRIYFYRCHLTYLDIFRAKVDDATTAVGSSAGWFKVGQIGLASMNPDYWGTQILNDNCGHFDIRVPAGISPGNYLLRAEVIALHVASSVGGAQ